MKPGDRMESLRQIAKLADTSKDVDEFVQRGCQDGVFTSMAEGRRVWSEKDMIQRKVGRLDA